jgi:beta-lactamase superfamily II metal-dependent hydrolase
MNCEIEFMPVGSGTKAGDAIVIRYGSPTSYELMVVDGGTLDSGATLVAHLQSTFGSQTSISHVVLTHPDADHASGLRTLLAEVPVKNLWMHVPWLHAAASRPYFVNKNWTDEGLVAAIKKEYDLLQEIFDLATSKAIPIYEPFAGGTIGPFQILSPHKGIYDRLMPQFDRTPEPDQVALEAEHYWLGTQQPSSLLAQLVEKAVAKVQKWVPETWEYERLKDGGITSASNETSVVLYGGFDAGKVLLTGDGGVWALTLAAHQAEQLGILLKDFKFVQIPHHGSRRNIGPTILNRLIGPIQQKGSASRFSAFVSAPPDDDMHPRKMVTNAFLRRGGTVIATQGIKKIYYGGFPARPGYSDAVPMEFATQVEDYD